jgi:hypothetical protein
LTAQEFRNDHGVVSQMAGAASFLAGQMRMNPHAGLMSLPELLTLFAIGVFIYGVTQLRRK